MATHYIYTSSIQSNLYTMLFGVAFPNYLVLSASAHAIAKPISADLQRRIFLLCKHLRVTVKHIFGQICSVSLLSFATSACYRETLLCRFAPPHFFPLATSACYGETHSWQILHHPVHQSLEL